MTVNMSCEAVIFINSTNIIMKAKIDIGNLAVMYSISHPYKVINKDE